MKRLILVILAASTWTATAYAAPLTPTQFVERHEAAAARSDVEAMLADYADNAVVLQASRTLEGKPAIRALFTRMFPKGGPAPKIEVERIWQEGNVGLVSWHMGTTKGLDSFLVRDGKIAAQAVFLNEPGPAAK